MKKYVEPKIHCINFKQDTLIQELEAKSHELYKVNVKEVSFIYIESDHEKNRLLLRKLINSSQNNNHFVLVSENKDAAFLGWKANLMAFLNIDSNSLDSGWNTVIDRLKTYPPEVDITQEKLRINFKGGFDLVSLKDICFLSGDGTYTNIFLHNGTKKIISYPLNVLESRLNGIRYLDRIGKSFIVNLNRVKSVKQEQLIFKGDKEISLKLGNTYIKRIKKNLLWY